MGETHTRITDRIRSGDDVAALIERSSVAFHLGQIKKFSLIETGYEDCNIDVLTNTGRYVLKALAAVREPAEIRRYADTLTAISRSNIAHPRIHTADDGRILYLDKDTNNHVIAMDHVDGSSFMDLGRTPTNDEIISIIEQVVQINSMPLTPSFLFDSWAVSNIEPAAEKVASFLDPRDKHLVNTAIAAVRDARAEHLPHCFVHGDITKTNVMLSADGKPFILDFAVANIYPRVQELGVIAANLLNDGSTPLSERTETVADSYDGLSPLTIAERNALYAYAWGATAMEFLGTLNERHFNNNRSKENDYWLSLGRKGLHAAAQERFQSS